MTEILLIVGKNTSVILLRLGIHSWLCLELAVGPRRVYFPPWTSGSSSVNVKDGHSGSMGL